MTNEEPQFLYRYRHLEGKHREWTKRIFTKSVLHFASPLTFNDPFDCKVHFRSSVPKLGLKRKYGNLVKKYMPNLNRAQRRTIAAIDVRAADIDEFLTKVTKGLQNSVNGVGVLSLSATDRNVLLWSHYAAGHSGLCLQFVATKCTPFFGQALQVDYPPNYAEVDLLKDSQDQLIKTFLLTKAIDWKYEEEWRIIHHNGGPGDKAFPEDLLVGVIFGARMEPEDQKVVKMWLDGRNEPVQLSKASVDPGTFSLKIEQYVP